LSHGTWVSSVDWSGCARSLHCSSNHGTWFPKLDVMLLVCRPCMPALKFARNDHPSILPPPLLSGFHSRSSGLAAVTIRSARFHLPLGHPRPLLRVNSSIGRAIFGRTHSCLYVPDEVQQDPYHLINVFQTAHSRSVRGFLALPSRFP